MSPAAVPAGGPSETDDPLEVALLIPINFGSRVAFAVTALTDPKFTVRGLTLMFGGAATCQKLLKMFISGMSIVYPSGRLKMGHLPGMRSHCSH